MTRTGHVLSVRNASLVHRSAEREFELTIPVLVLHSGDRLALVGRSGSGKSSVLDILGLASCPDHVERFEMVIRRYEDGAHRTLGDMVDVSKMLMLKQTSHLDHVRSTGIGYVLQTGGLLPFASVLENILLSVRAARPVTSEDRDWIGEVTHQLGITHLLDTKPKRLSVGERQRVAIARAVAHRPALLLADEPTAALDPQSAHDTLDLLIRMTKEAGNSLIIASHDRQLIQEFNFPLASHGLQVVDGSSRRVKAFFSFDECAADKLDLAQNPTLIESR